MTCFVSFEFFPPKTESGLAALADHQKKLATYSPDYVSMTFGALGAKQDVSLNLIKASLNYFKPSEVVPHISCINMTTPILKTYIQAYQALSIQKLVVIRGDKTDEQANCLPEFTYAEDLIQAIESIAPHYFSFKVAGYPEKHPESVSWLCEMDYLKKKVDRGASEIITQYFFSPIAYEKFVDDCQKHHINIPIRPGIMPIRNYESLCRFSKQCGAEIPQWLSVRLESYKTDEKSFRQFSDDVVSQLCENLIKQNAPGLHFYTLNQSFIVQTILSELSL